MRLRFVLVLLALGLLAPRAARPQTPPECPPGQSIPVTLQVRRPCPGQPLELLAEACGPCVDLRGVTTDPSGPIRIHAEMDTRRCILDLCVRDTLAVPLGIHAPGHYELAVVVDGPITHADSTTCFSATKHVVAFDVPRDCGGEPPPPGLPYVQRIQVGVPPICPAVPIPFTIGGHMPDGCHRFAGLELLPNPEANPRPQPPIARVHVEVDCPGTACTMATVPWTAHAVLPGLPPGEYGMRVEVVEVRTCEGVPHVVGSAIVPFAVAVDCSLPPQPFPGCYIATWRHRPDALCNAEVSNGSPAKLVFEISNGPPIAGIQGRIALSPPALQITDVRPIGDASGMRLAWHPRADGASFVLFSEDGTAIPSNLPCITTDLCPPHPVLEVTVSATTGSTPPPVTFARMIENELLVTDPLGNAIMHCPSFAPIEIVARICSGGGACDANGDGHIDVRDLVLMVRCLRNEPDCPDAVRGRLDCDGDSTFTLDDVMCCAQRVLRGTLPDSLPPQPLSDLAVELGGPVATAEGFDQSVHVRGADRLGAARFALRYPSDWTLTRVELAGAPADWMHLEEPGAGQSLVGLLSIAPNVTPDVEAVFHFATPPGTVASAGVTLADAEFVATDGRVVMPQGGILGIPDASRPHVDLSAARPNPFAEAARFELSLTAAADVQLGIYDLSGRLVVSLHRGQLDAGTHSFIWDGKRADGTRAPDGVYFYSARSASGVTSRRIVSMRGR